MKSTWVLAGLLSLQSSAVLAADAIKGLPASGSVTLAGTISRIADRDTLILKDDSGSTIDVHTNEALNVELGQPPTIGQRIQVHGTLQSEMLGFGREIINAHLTPIANDNRAMGGPLEPLDETNARY